jgi:excisionase family DNA binding protein
MPSYLTTSDVAARLGVSLDTVRRWLRSGELKGTPFGRAGYRIEDADFQAFLERRRHAQELVPAEEETVSSAVFGEFMSTVGQELRMPLTTTRGALHQARRLLERVRESPLPDNTTDLLTKLQHLLMRAERQVSSEVRLVANLLDASRIEANIFEVSPVWCNLVEIVRETVMQQRELAVQRSIELELPDDDIVAVIADPERIQQALLNYLANALRFSPADQPITVYLTVSSTEARITVQDRGPGIPDPQQGTIWESFRHETGRSIRSGSGPGLGLYITRAIIQRHGGQVGVVSRPGEGARFWCTLPLADDTWN